MSATSTGRASDSVNYVYDKAGNPTSRKELGLTTAYTFNNLNQFVSGSWTGKLTVIGEVNYAAGTVTVNGVTGRIFPDRVFEATNITVSAGTNVLTAVYQGPAFTNTQMVATNTSSVVIVNPTFGYDAKGKLTNDAEFVYQYDMANRLTNVISKASGSSVLAARYDGLGRRIEVTRNGSTVERYVYFPGSFLVLAVLDGSNQLKEIYTHGPDLSGVVGGAGGIGGILSVSTNIGAASAVKYFHADAMGNVVLVSDPDGEQVASYGFTPFGKLVTQVGDYKARFLFSSKERDPETGLILFGYRFLRPELGVWLTRDVLGEVDGPALYRFVLNQPLNAFDALGLQTSSQTAQNTNCCCTVTVIVEVPSGRERSKLGRKGLSGHLGIAVDGDYFDHGPQPGRGTSLFGSRGRPWWDQMFPGGDADLSDIVGDIDNLAHGLKVYEVTITANPSECADIKQYWQKLYSSPGTYRFYGRQCTTTVCQSLKKSGLLRVRVLKPSSLLKVLQQKAVHTCGPDKGNPASVKQIWPSGGTP